MNFTSGIFLLLFPLIAALYPPLNPTWRRGFLLAMSWVLYLYAGRWAFGILLLITLWSWACTLRLEGETDPIKRKRLFALGSSGILVILLFFKYGDWLVRSYGPGGQWAVSGGQWAVSGGQWAVSGGQWAVSGGQWAVPGGQWAVPVSQWAVPAGLSFYTFQSVGYFADVYRKKIKAERSFWKYALFVSFFPQLVAGPIEKAGELLPALSCETAVTKEQRRIGSWWILRGYFKKIAVADFLAPYVDAVFSGAAGLNCQGKGPVFAAAAILFSLQIYADFSGYSDIARGSAAWLGIPLSENFRLPYLAESFRDFWRRWHITLNRWFTDYVYIPLGGSRRGMVRQCLLTLLVFGLSGIWHGAAPHFVAWGVMHGTLVVLEIGISALRKEKAGQRKRETGAAGWRKLLKCGFIYLVVTAGWIWFRADSVREAAAIFRCLPTGWETALPGMLAFASSHTAAWIRILLLPAAMYLLDTFPGIASRQKSDSDSRNVQELAAGEDPHRVQEMTGLTNVYLFWLLLLTVLTAALVWLHSGSENAFLYFRF